MNPIDRFEKDEFQTSEGILSISFLGHGSLYLTFQQKNIYIDPFSRVADYSALPKADLILITHEHQDHLDPQAIQPIRTEKTVLIVTGACAAQIQGGIVMGNGDRGTAAGIPVRAVPAYNLVHKRENGQPFHPQGAGNGYLLTLGDKLLYVAGDTEDIPEMKDLTGIDIAFLPMNLPYTMTPAMVAATARAFRPKVLYPYHFGSTDTAELVKLLKDESDIEVRIRKLA